MQPDRIYSFAGTRDAAAGSIFCKIMLSVRSNREVAMSKIALLLITTAVLSWCQEDSEPKPTLSNEPLTAEQVAVYSAFLKVYDYGSDTNLNVANVTDPLDLSMFEMKEGRGCLKGIFFGNLKQARSVV